MLKTKSDQAAKYIISFLKKHCIPTALAYSGPGELWEKGALVERFNGVTPDSYKKASVAS